MRNVLIILAGVFVGVALRYLLPPPAPKSAEVTPETPHAVLSASESKPTINPAYIEPGLYVRGYVTFGRRANVFLSDGTTWTEQQQGELKIFRHYVLFRGKSYPIKAAPSIVSPLTVSPYNQTTIGVVSNSATSTVADTVGADLMNASRR